MKLIQPCKPSKRVCHVLSIRLLGGLIVLFTGLLELNAQAQILNGIQSHDEIRQAAKKFLEEKQPSADNPNIRISLGKIDPRLRLVSCDGEIEAFLPQSSRSSGRITVGVRCNGTVAWKLFIPANIQISQTVWVTNRHLSPHESITLNDLTQKKMQVANMRKVPIIDLNSILNTSPKRTLRAGSVIFQDSVCMVCRGERVSISAQSQFIDVLVEGVALNDATIGETAQIKNSKSKRIFAAIVTGKNQLRVKLSEPN